jgi:hypothetical protein
VKQVDIERREKLTPAIFRGEYLEGTGKPVIVTDATRQWPAMQEWTFDHLKAAYGDDTVLPAAGVWSTAVKMTKLGTYIDHLDMPNEKLSGFWVDRKAAVPIAAPLETPTSPLYLLDWKAFRRHPELYAGIKPDPYFIDDWVLSLGPELQEVFERASGRDYWDLILGPAGALSELHQDFWHTHGCLTQIRGRKRCILFSPDDSPFLYDGRVNPEAPDCVRVPLLRQTTAFEAVLEPGEILFIPPAWWHCVRSLEKSLTLSHNFFNQTNFSRHMASFLPAYQQRVVSP